MIHPIQFDSWITWVTVLVLWAIHGDETCWPISIQKIIKEIQEKQLALKTGKVTFIPICNPEAHKVNKRLIDVNLNRVMKYHKNPEKYEEKLANEIIEFIKKADVVLDIHSISSKGKPFVFQDYMDKGSEGLSQALWVENIVKWWPEMYEKTESSDTMNFTHNEGKIWVTIECGNHNEESSQSVAYKAIKNMLKYLSIIDWERETLKQFNSVTAIKFIIKEKEGSFEKDWQHLDPMKEGEVIVNYSDGTKILAPYDGYILLPFAKAKIGDEWFYFGK